MASYNENPFAGDSENPFADPSVASHTSNAARGLEDFNPFAEQNTSQASGAAKLKTTPAAPPPAPRQPAASPSASQPAVLQTKEEPPPYVVEEEQENLRKRQEELERKAAELQRKEQELQRMQFGGYRENNFPPLPSKCPCKPCFFHDISIDIPIQYQKTCKLLFYRWQVYSFTMFYNFLAAFALLVGDAEPIHEGETFGLSILYLVANVPLSFLGWYRPAYNGLNNVDGRTLNLATCVATNTPTANSVYCFVLFFNFLAAMALLIKGPGESKTDTGSTFGLSALYLIANVPLSFIGWYRPCYRAFKNDSSFSYVIFFLIFFLHIGINIFYCLGVPGSGACGFINATQAIHNSLPVGAMMFVAGGLFLLGVIVDIFLLLKVHKIYRMAGASFEKAQGEFARGMASNPHVQNAATEVAAAGVRSAISGDNRK